MIHWDKLAVEWAIKEKGSLEGEKGGLRRPFRMKGESWSRTAGSLGPAQLWGQAFQLSPALFVPVSSTVSEPCGARSIGQQPLHGSYMQRTDFWDRYEGGGRGPKLHCRMAGFHSNGACSFQWPPAHLAEPPPVPILPLGQGGVPYISLNGYWEAIFASGLAGKKSVYREKKKRGGRS